MFSFYYITYSLAGWRTEEYRTCFLANKFSRMTNKFRVNQITVFAITTTILVSEESLNNECA